MNSAIYTGTVTHRRYIPKKHSFTYTVFMSYLDLDELGKIFTNIPFWSDSGKKNIAYFNRNDYLRPSNKPLKTLVQETIHKKLNVNHTGPIKMLTHLRILGCCFNPVTFYYCFNATNKKLDYVLADITNTPWNERHQYLIDLKNNDNMQFKKAFHISPFMDMEMDYDWQFSTPNDTLSVKMLANKKKCFFKANMLLNKKTINTANTNNMLIKHCFINYKVIWGIYWQAAKLYLKQVPFYSHPNK